ncbi:HET-domain-containing protein [Bimuria novae-zelandiae CBS 107.79]|uniref:HET-domain-containing protein n=1 Tax=Bimuria novae-zelandiae CBS 107.79 TaxID=1447943 RepID=A0A6A5ULU9_9PLEO|nr:HET-domain-containing protein [Bimuria novae-zelandiae CBS 107.79]
MRLLHFDALGRLVLTDFRGKAIPPYAILSHRWSDSEILLEDIASGAYKDRQEGYRKLKFCAKQAFQDKLQFFWIDTCCIDRWDLRERSKAINSMFQWYKNATRCYVFLSDVSLSTATESTATESSQRSDWEAAFRASAWFTRGWTLQELIAPVSVEFFTYEGQRIGDKASLDELLHAITSIPLKALRNCPLEHFTISERERWAENRRTTEEEDIIYCLLGVLGISVPTVYGEGKESARSRLQAEVEAANNVPSIIPFSRNPRFVGRELQLAELEAKLFSNEQTTTTLAIVGPGGTGKSQLALEVAHRTRQNNKNCSVFWMDASDKDSLYQSYASVAQKLSIPGWDDDQADIKQLAKRCVVEISARQCLLIFDNAEDTILRSGSLPTTEAADLADCLPQSNLCSAIFTTINYGTAEALAPHGVIALQELALDTALKMLQTRLAAPLSNTEQQEAKHLLGELSYLPLAVAQAAACMNASGMTVQNYQAQLDEHKEAAIEHRSDSCAKKPRSAGITDPVAATLFLSIHQIVRENALAADHLFLASCVNRKDISIDLLEAASPQAREDAIKVLDRSKWRRLLPHTQYALSHRPTDDDDKDRLDLSWKCAMALYRDGRYEEAEELFVQVMETRKRVLGEEHPDTLTSMANLASTYRNQGRWKEAEGLFVQVMETRKRVLGEEHPDTLTSMANLASTYRNQGRWKEAEGLFVQVMETSSRVLGEEHPDTLTSINNLAFTLQCQARHQEALALMERCFRLSQQVLGEQHPET